MSPARFVLSCGLVAAALQTLVAAPKIDWDRLAPVPADQPIPIQDFFRPPLWRDPRLNPSGTHLAGLVHAEDDTYRLLIYELDTQKTQVLAGEGDKDIYNFRWLDDRRMVFFLSNFKLYGLGMFGVEVDRMKEAYALLQYCGATLVSVPRDDRLFPLVWLRNEWLENDRDGGVAVVHSGLKSGKFINLMHADADRRLAMEARENNVKHVMKTYPAPREGIVYHYMADRDGRLAFAFTSENGLLAMHWFTPEGEWKKCPIDIEAVQVIGPGDQPGEVLAIVHDQPDAPQVLRFYNAVTGEPGEILLADKGYDFDGYIYREAGSRQIVGLTYTREGPRSVWFDEGFRGVQKAVDGLFPGQMAQIIGNSEKGARFLVRTFSDRQPVSYHWVDLEKRTAALIRNTAPWIDPQRMRPRQTMKYKTNDGRSIDAYVTLPAGASKKAPVPLVVLPHGGPWVRDSWGFDSEAQFLASRGYAVLQPNYRGSTGYDWMFPVEDQWEFRKMHDDVTAATLALLETGLIDRSRIAIMGGSFGGYLALSGVVHEPSLYRCAVTIAGVFDWATVLKDRKYDQFTDASYAHMLRKLGDPKDHAEKFDAISPVRHISNVRVPLLVAHGKQDQIASITESRRLVSELEKHKVPHEKLFIGGEGHGMARLKNQVELYSRIEEFLAKNLAPLPAGARAGCL